MTTFKKVVGNNFDPYLVGLQFTSDGGSPLFTVGNFQITTNLSSPPKRNFQLGSFSDPLTLENLGSNLNEAYQLVNDNLNVFLNLDTQNLLNFTLFGSFTEFVNVTLNQVYYNWPASIYVYYSYGSVFGNTFSNYVYNSLTDTATFQVSTNFFYNYYGINFLQNAVSFSATSLPSSIRNLATFYAEYVIYVNNTSYRIIGFTGSNTITNGICYFTVQGDPFNGAPSGTISYHIRPNDAYLDRFFSNIDDFTRFLLNRNSVPQYTCTIFYEEITEDNFRLQRSKTLTWPVSDGYNLDRNTGDFLIYKSELLEIAENYDNYKTDLMRRVLVTESISYSELNPKKEVYYPLNTTDKIEKLLHIYGREFDEVRKYIDGISYASTVSYNKQGNTPDALIKDFAYYLGWDILSPMDENQLLANFTPTQSVYSGMTVGYTPAEAEVEFWRRLVLNSAFLWKSKGTRKGIEFLFDFINTPPALVNFNEYIYQAKSRLDVNKFKQILQYLYGNTNIDSFNVDEDGFPRVPVDTLQMYFQKGGGWYRETAGANSQIDYYEGNNPHIGPYDGGQEYINRFRCLLDSFSGQTIKITDEHVEFTNLFANYYQGNIDNYTGDVYVDPVDQNNNPTNCIIITGSVITNPSTTPEYSVCGCIIPSAITQAIVINVKKNPYVEVSCSGDTDLSVQTVLSDLQSCSPCKATGLNSGLNTVIYDCGGLPTQSVPIECCQSVANKINFTWIETNNTELGLCYYDDPCSNLLYLGNYIWVDSTNPPAVVVTSTVPKNCCLYRGGVYNELTGICEAPL